MTGASRVTVLGRPCDGQWQQCAIRAHSCVAQHLSKWAHCSHPTLSVGLFAVPMCPKVGSAGRSRLLHAQPMLTQKVFAHVARPPLRRRKCHGSSRWTGPLCRKPKPYSHCALAELIGGGRCGHLPCRKIALRMQTSRNGQMPIFFIVGNFTRTVVSDHEISPD